MMPEERLRTLVVVAGLTAAALSLIVGLAAELQLFGDGSIFAYSVAVTDAWAFHWRNISGRVFSYVAIYIPAEAVVALTGSARAGVFAYGLLLFAAPAFSLAATWALDRTPRQLVFVFACLSTACILPFVFGFPTEMAMAHAVFWPALATCLQVQATSWRNVGVFGLLLALVLTHEGGVVLAAAIVGAVSLRGFRDSAFRRTSIAYLGVLPVWYIVKALLPPDSHIAGVLGAAAFKFISFGNLAEPAFLVLAGAVASYLLMAWSMGRPIAAAGMAVAALVVYWSVFDNSLLAEARYALRTILLIATPTLGVLAVAISLPAGEARASPYARILVPVRGILARAEPGVLGGALAICLLVHGVESAKFVSGWIEYKSAVRSLATGTDSDPELGDDRFVSAARIAQAPYRLAWNSTTPFLSVLVVPGFDPSRLVVDPQAGYFWLSCETATRSRERGNAIPTGARELVRRHACFNR